MRTLRVCVALVGVLAALGGATAAQAAPRWPARCKTMSCVNAHLNQLHAQMVAVQAKNKAQTKTINQITGFLDNCLFVTAVDETTGGAPLTLTNTGDKPSGGWFLIDGCQGGTAAKPAVPRRDTGFRRFHARSGTSRV